MKIMIETGRGHHYAIICFHLRPNYNNIDKRLKQKTSEKLFFVNILKIWDFFKIKFSKWEAHETKV